jgi:hypothetical protein
MAAFTGFDPIDEKRDESKYAGYDVAGLEKTIPQQNVPSQPSGGAASQGALEAPAPAGATSPAFGDTKKADDPEPVSDFHRMYLKGDDKDRDAVADRMEEQFGEQGLSLQGAVNKVFEEGGQSAMQLAERFGYIPPEESAGKGAFKTREQALADYGVEMDEAKEQKLVAQKKDANRRAMGGFLMDVGLRILASNREDAGGAIGEGALGARQSRKDERRQTQQDEMAAEDRARKQRREDTADEAGRIRESREAESYEYEKSQRAAAEAKANLVEITTKGGEVYFVNREEGLVEDEDGVPIRTATAEDLSAAQRRVREDNRARLFHTERRAIQKLVDEDTSDDPEINAISEETSGDKRRQMINDLANKRLGASAEDDDPLGLL